MTTPQQTPHATTEPRSPRPRSGRPATIIGVVSSLAFLLGGLLLIGFASSAVGYELWVFLAGILSASFAFYIPLSIIRWVDGA